MSIIGESVVPRYLQLTNFEPDTTGINTMWDQVKTAYTQTSESFLGHRQKKRKEWITTWHAIENRRTLKRKVMESNSKRPKEGYKKQFWEADRTVKRKIRADKRAHMENLASQVEEAANRREQGKVYKVGRYTP